MNYVQVKKPNINISYTGGYCLRYVYEAFGVSKSVWKNDSIASYRNQNNKGKIKSSNPPIGIYTPIYFSLSNNVYGHIAIALPDGRVASASQKGNHSAPYIHPNIQHLIDYYSWVGNNPKGRVCKYLGFSTELEGTIVAKEETKSNAAFEKGSEVILNGKVYMTSNGEKAGKTFTNHKGKITLINKEGTKPYHIDKLGWVAANDIKKINNTSPKFPFKATVKKGSTLYYYDKGNQKYPSSAKADRSCSVLSESNGRYKISCPYFSPNIIYCDKGAIK